MANTSRAKTMKRLLKSVVRIMEGKKSGDTRPSPSVRDGVKVV